MTQREVQDSESMTWVCVQALSGLSGEAGEAAAEKIESNEGTVPVVCTPRGGAQSVRIELPKDWEESIPDAELVKRIEAARG